MFDFLEVFDSLGLQALIVLLFAGIGLAIYSVLAQMDDKAGLRDALRSLDDYEVESVRDQELLVPLKTRVFAPVVDIFSRFGSKFNPPDFVEEIRKKHVRAGIYSPDRVERFLAMRILGFMFMPVWFLIMITINPLGVQGKTRILAIGVGMAIGAIGPASQLTKKVQARQKAIQRSLPDVMDLLVISVEAGLGFEQALDRVIQNVPGELSDEFSRVLGESRAGASRSDALRAMDDRCDTPEVRSFVLAMIQADTFGVSIGRVLRSQSDELRVKRRQKAQEQAQKAPVKMLIPMVFCIFPALFIVVIGPAGINISQAF